MSRAVNNSTFGIIPVGDHTRDATISTATTLTIPAGSSGVLMSADTADLTYTLDCADGSATDPTATIGFTLVAGDPPIRIDLWAGATVKVISATGAVQYMFFKVVDTGSLANR